MLLIIYLILLFQRHHSNIHKALTNPPPPPQPSQSLSTFITQQPRPISKWASTDPGQQQRITSAIVDFVAQDLQPLSVVESPAFRHILETAEPRYRMPSRKHLSSTLLPTLYLPSSTAHRQAEQCLSHLPHHGYLDQPSDEILPWDYSTFHLWLHPAQCYAFLLPFSRPSHWWEHLQHVWGGCVIFWHTG